MNRYYNLGCRIGGVSIVGPGTTDFQKRADQVWKMSRLIPAALPYAVITIDPDATKYTFQPFAQESDAADKYGTLADHPAGIAYLAMYDGTSKGGDDPRVNEMAFSLVNTVTPAAASPVPAPIASVASSHATVAKAGLGLAGALGLLALIAKH